jgi:ATP-dependent DNA helicase RecG
VANLFQFYQRVFTKLATDLKVPFEIEGTFPSDPLRKGFSAVHEAIQEALVNALIHADYRGMGGIVIDKYPDRIEMSNPGSLLVSIDQLLQGGISECRNKSLQQMFQHIGAGDKAGSGVDKIVQGWKSKHWRPPSIQEKTRPDRVELVLPMVSLIPPESLGRLRRQFGDRFDTLQQLEVQILVTAEIEGEVSNSRIRLFSDQHPSDLTRMLQGLVGKGFLVRDGQGRWSTYRLPAQAPDSAQIGEDSTQIDDQTPHIADEDSTQTEFEPELLAIAQPAREKSKLQAEQMRTIILALCKGRFLTPRQLGGLTSRSPVGLQQNYLREMTHQGKLQLRYPQEPNHPDQAYTTKE